VTVVEFQAWGSLALGAGFIPVAAVFFALVYAGAVLTRPGDRTRLGNWLAVFCGAMGTLFTCLAVITFNRWIDLDPDSSNWVIGVTFRIVGIVALVIGLIAAHYAAPALIVRILRGPNDPPDPPQTTISGFKPREQRRYRWFGQ
jgi:MFS family permease